ncbi:MAG TPA: hypothetical protein PLB62_08245, partial [Candidatus Sumerlaeota bacterium]|nr:hypothetical protein [Candidatus Sumerlaeota bacterium]
PPSFILNDKYSPWVRFSGKSKTILILNVFLDFVKFYNIRDAGKAEAIGLDSQGARYSQIAPRLERFILMNLFMELGTFNSEKVILPDILNKHQSTLSWAINKVAQR